MGLELDVTGEEAILVNFGRKTFWRGDFSLMLDRLWGIGLSLSSLRSLLPGTGPAPAAEFLDKGIDVSLERAAGGGAPAAVRLRRGGAELTLRILQGRAARRGSHRPGRLRGALPRRRAGKRPGTMIALRSFAKINLGLEITGQRADGYHTLRTVFQTIDLSDELRAA